MKPIFLLLVALLASSAVLADRTPPMTDAVYSATIVSCIGSLTERQSINAAPGTITRVSDSDIIQVVLSPTWRDAPVYSARFDPLLIGMWVKQINPDFTYSDGILMPDGTLWEDRDSNGTQRFSEYMYKSF